MQTFDNDAMLTQVIAAGRVDAFLTPSIDALRFIKNYPNTIYLPDWGAESVKDDAAFTLPKT